MEMAHTEDHVGLFPFRFIFVQGAPSIGRDMTLLADVLLFY
jgi:hypothetical protein